MASRLIRKLDTILVGPFDPARQDLFLRAFALTLLIYVIERAQHPYEWLTDEGFHYSAAVHELWLPPPPPLLPHWAVFPFLALFCGAAGVLVLGKWRLPATAVCLLCTIYVTYADPASAFTLNKLYIATLTVIVAGQLLNRVTKAGIFPISESAWPCRVIQATLLIQYFTAGTCKVVYGDWLESTTVLWSQAQGVFRSELCGWMLVHVEQKWWALFQYQALMFELSAPFLLLFRRTRYLAMVWGIGFHLGIALLMYKLIYFSLQMIAFYILFLDPEVAARIARLGETWRNRGVALLPQPVSTRLRGA